VWPLDRDVEVNCLLAAPSSREHRLRSDWSSEAKAEDQRLRCASMKSEFMNVELLSLRLKPPRNAAKFRIAQGQTVLT
jgi:hypothetical protein